MTIRHVEGATVQATTAFFQEAMVEREWYLYYSIGADLSVRIQQYAEHGYSLGEPEQTGYLTREDGPLIIQGQPIHRRKLIKRNSGPSADELSAMTEEENQFPLAGKDDPISYTRDQDGLWLIYQRGNHLRSVLDALWNQGKAVSTIEVQCKAVDPDDGSVSALMYRGKPVFRRLVVPKELGLNPADIQ